MLGGRGTPQPDRRAYDERLAGRCLAGTLNLTTMLIEMEQKFFALLRDAKGEQH